MRLLCRGAVLFPKYYVFFYEATPFVVAMLLRGIAHVYNVGAKEKGAYSSNKISRIFVRNYGVFLQYITTFYSTPNYRFT